MTTTVATAGSVLIVDDEATLREVLSLRLEKWGFEVRTAADATEAYEQFADHPPDIILSDVVMPGDSGFDLLRHMLDRDTPPMVILMTAHGTIESAVQGIKEGATDFLTKPIDYTRLHALLERTRARRDEEQRAAELEHDLRERPGLGGLIGVSRPMEALYETVRLLASSEASALISGESGTGKEVVARTVHELSSRRDGPFVAVNAAAMPEGLIESELFGHEKGAFTGALRDREGFFEAANGGTLFLDELAEMPIALQPKLLRVLEDGVVKRLGSNKEVHFDVRVLAATNRNPLEAIEQGLLREDLFFRLNVFDITIPPLRQRPGDLPLLVQHLIGLVNRKHGTEVVGAREEAVEALGRYRWPGNVRELRNVVERSVIHAREGWIETKHLPRYVTGAAPQRDTPLAIPEGTTVAELEKELILQTLEQAGNNKAEAARRLGLNVKTIRNKLRSYEEAPK